MHVTVSRILSSLLVLTLAVALRAQAPIDLRLNGEHHAAAAIGSMMDISAATTPNVWGSIIFSANPGPTLVYGLYNIPIGIDATTIVNHPFYYSGPSGVFTDSVPLLNDILFEGVTYYAYTYTWDASDPTGFGASNQARVTFTRQVLGGADSAGFIGEDVTLDGSAIAAQGPMPSNLGVSWSVANGPAGHNAVISGADTLFPTLDADLPGSYDLEVSLGFPGTTGGAADTVTVEVFDLDVTSQAQGAFSTVDPVPYAATLGGPAGATLSQGALATTAGSIAGSKAAAPLFTSFDFGVQANGGQKLGRGHSVVNNLGASLATTPLDSLAAHLEQPLLDQIETVMETALAAVNLGGSLAGVPPISLVNTTFFTATATLQSISYDPTIDVELSFDPGAVGVQLTLTNVVLVFDVNGTIVFAPYTDTGILTMATVTIDFDLIPGLSGGMFASTTANETATVSGSSLVFTGNIIPASQTGTILALLIPTIEGLMATTVPPLVPPLIDSALNSIPQTLDLSGQGVAVTLSFTPSSVTVVSGSMTIAYDAGAAANAIAPGTAALQGYYSTPSIVPAYTGTTPQGGATYQLAASLADDFLNQLIAAALEAGAFELDLGGSFDLGGTTLNGDAGSFALAFPGLGFDKFDALAPVTLSLHPTIAPVITIDNTGGSNYGLEIADIVVDVRVEVAPGYDASVLKLGASAATGLGIVVNTTTNTIDLIPGAATATVQGLSSLPGVDLGPSLAALTTLVNGALPGILMPVSGIPIPTVAGTTFVPVVVGIEADGPLGDYLSIFFN